MSESMHSKTLRRMTGRPAQDASDPPMTASRAVRLAVAKVADDSVGLVLTVKDMNEDLHPLDDVVAALDDDLMLIELQRDGALAGIIALDMQLRAAVMEMQTVGSLIAMAAEPRPATGTDKTMCDPLLDQLLQALPPAMAGSELDGFVHGCTSGRRIASVRAAGLVLADCDYRILRIAIDLGVADRQGLLVIALPPIAQPDPIEPERIDDMDWGVQFRSVAANAQATLTAHLHKFSIPLARTQSLQVGQVLPLTGCDVHSVRLISLDGKKVAQAKLGQFGGMRAVRIEKSSPLQMTELPQKTAILPQVSGNLDRADPLALKTTDAQGRQSAEMAISNGAASPIDPGDADIGALSAVD